MLGLPDDPYLKAILAALGGASLWKIGLRLRSDTRNDNAHAQVVEQLRGEVKRLHSENKDLAKRLDNAEQGARVARELLSVCRTARDRLQRELNARAGYTVEGDDEPGG